VRKDVIVERDILPGKSYPLGATVYPDGVNFSVFSKSCSAVELLLFNDPDDAVPARVIRLDPARNRTFYYWHAFVRGLKAGQLYGYRVYGPHDPSRGLFFDGFKLLIDPYAKAVAIGRNYDRSYACRPGDNCAWAPKSVVIDPSDYDWEGDEPLLTPYSSTVIYELHVGGFTRHPNSGLLAHKRGTYAGLVEKIGYLKDLGVTAVELMPVQQFDEQDAKGPLCNYWGYSPMAFFAPHCGYSSAGDPVGAVNEFRDMVKTLHRHGIEVIVDVVFNHTAEAGHDGPTFSLRGFENPAYYIYNLDNERFENYSGCGNTINANNSVVRTMILDCLRYWVEQMHVDGFRFDLASIMSRGELGEPLERPPILWSIESDPVLAGAKIIAEAWDAAGLYQVGSFTGERFAEWNSHFRDDVRAFVKGDADTVHKLSNRILGSPDIYPQPDRDLNRSINFVTCHDGFTLNDLVTYNTKSNAANLENNRDGSNCNCSWNCGVEGEADDPEVERLRLRQIRNFLTILFISQGTPMLLMGDEVRRTQRGNNNAYCQNSELTWFDWDLTLKNEGLLRFTRGLIDFTGSYSLFHQKHEPARYPGSTGTSIIWHGVHLNGPDFSGQSHSIALEIRTADGEEHVFVMLNSYWEDLSFELPHPGPKRSWRRVIDTSLPEGEDFVPLGKAPKVVHGRYRLADRSSAVLVALP
jgi:glycogen operon protein